MVEALVILEREGKIAPLTSSVATAEQTAGNGAGSGPAAFGATGYYYGTRAPKESLWTKIKDILLKSVTYSFIVRRRGREILSLPVLIMIIVVLALFKVSAVALLIGLFCECRYSVEERPGAGTTDGTNGG